MSGVNGVRSEIEKESETRLSEFSAKLSDLSGSLSGARCRLNCLSDRLVGSVPEEARNGVACPQKEGAIGELDDKIDSLVYEVSGIVQAVNRINDAGIA